MKVVKKIVNQAVIKRKELLMVLTLRISIFP
jgi:hypothetical protein